MITSLSLTTVKKGGPPAKDPPLPAAETAVQSQVGSEILKARNAAGKQAKSSPHAEYQRPHRAHVGAFVREAQAQSHKKMLEDEAGRNQLLEAGPLSVGRDDEIEKEQRISGINFDEERKKRGRRREEDDDEPEDAEEAVALGQAAAEKGFAQKEGGGKYFQDLPDDRMGDLSLTNPNDMKRLLGPSVRFAQHAMLLAEDRLKSGTDRLEVIEFLASLYVGVADRAYALKALREFGTGTGIIDIYPLEVMSHLLENVPAFFTKVQKGRFFSSNKTGVYKSETGKPIVLTYDPALRIRGFALDGGPRPGYLFEPVDPPGTYHLTFQTAGTYKVMVSAIAKNGSVAIEELAVEIVQGTATLDNAAAIQRERAHEAESSEETDQPAREPSAPSKKDDLTIHFPKRI